jgi:hypothetical protein
MARSSEDGAELVSFFYKNLQFASSHDLTVNQHLEPKNCFVRFLHHDTDLRNPLCFRPGPTGSAIICGHRSPGSKQLFTQDLRIRPIRQRTVKPDNSHCESFCPISKFLWRRHQVSQITKLPDYQITKYLMRAPAAAPRSLPFQTDRAFLPGDLRTPDGTS